MGFTAFVGSIGFIRNEKHTTVISRFRCSPLRALPEGMHREARNQEAKSRIAVGVHR